MNKRHLTANIENQSYGIGSRIAIVDQGSGKYYKTGSTGILTYIDSNGYWWAAFDSGQHYPGNWCVGDNRTVLDFIRIHL